MTRDYQVIYLAGKIEKNDWRHKIVPDLRHTSPAYDKPWVLEHWRTIPTIFPGIVYGGPYFTGCDHGCAHTDGNHAILEDPVCGQNSPRHLIPGLCADAIRSSDIVFAWLGPDTEETHWATTHWLTTGDSVDFTPAPFSCYGTLVELGYAKAVGYCKIITATTSSDMLGGTYFAHRTAPDLNRQPLGLDELWFAHQIADHNIIAPDPLTAVHEALETLTPPQPPSPFNPDGVVV